MANNQTSCHYIENFNKFTLFSAHYYLRRSTTTTEKSYVQIRQYFTFVEYIRCK